MTIDHAEAEQIARARISNVQRGYDIEDNVTKLARAYLDARANQRTPGCREICPKCRIQVTVLLPGATGATCQKEACPLKGRRVDE